MNHIIICWSLQDGVTALLIASEYGHEEVARLLLQSGAQDIPDKVYIMSIIVYSFTIPSVHVEVDMRLLVSNLG